MNASDPFDHDEEFALNAYAALPRSQPPAIVDARIRAAAHAVNAVRRPRRWTTGLATAAVAVLAVGLAWRGLETARPDYAPAPVPQVVPTMQPAFKLETAASAVKKNQRGALGGATRDDERARARVPQAPPTPALSTADWEAPEADRLGPARAAKSKVRPEPRQETAAQSELLFDQPLPMSAPAPAPAVSTAPHSDRSASAGVPAKSMRQAERANDAAEERAKKDVAVIVPEPAPSVTHVFAQDPSGQAKPDSVEREQAGTPSEASALDNRSDADMPVSSLSIRSGASSYQEAVAAARLARAHGDTAAARVLVAAMVERFGQQRLPADLRALR